VGCLLALGGVYGLLWVECVADSRWGVWLALGEVGAGSGWDVCLIFIISVLCTLGVVTFDCRCQLGKLTSRHTSACVSDRGRPHSTFPTSMQDLEECSEK
jgi:hypothetical protein